MKDIAGREIVVGDWIACAIPERTTARLEFGKVTRMTTKTRLYGRTRRRVQILFRRPVEPWEEDSLYVGKLISVEAGHRFLKVDEAIVPLMVRHTIEEYRQ